jgi:hypothetical protein
LSNNSWSSATPRRHVARRDEGCPLVLRYAVWRGKIACVSFLSGYAEVALSWRTYSSFPVIPKASLGERKTQLDCLLRPETSLASVLRGNSVADAEIPL